METQTVSAREAVARSVQRWWNLGLGECRDAADSWDMTCGK
jgi:prenylcysteine oxidase/farnesylcysteine lyase